MCLACAGLITLQNYTCEVDLPVVAIGIWPTSPVARPILPIVNPEICTIASFFLLKCIHIGYWKL